MTDDTEAGVDLETLDIGRLQAVLTPRQLGLWELATGTPFADFPQSWLAALLCWWASNEQGEPMTPDEALDLPGDRVAVLADRALELLGKPAAEPAGGGPRSAISSAPTSPASLRSA